jgi:hypothetical protein
VEQRWCQRDSCDPTRRHAARRLPPSSGEVSIYWFQNLEAGNVERGHIPRFMFLISDRERSRSGKFSVKILHKCCFLFRERSGSGDGSGNMATKFHNSDTLIAHQLLIMNDLLKQSIMQSHGEIHVRHNARRSPLRTPVSPRSGRRTLARQRRRSGRAPDDRYSTRDLALPRPRGGAPRAWRP